MIGMLYKILPTKEFSKDFKKVDNQLQKRIKDKIEEVAENPFRYKHLHYDLKGSCRLWVGKLRIIYSYDIQKQELYLEKIVLDHKYQG
ncbi:type II toxin-antitoxin system RelE/ParE family toxin [Candidatus Woesearchaeota archaeon]|nr:type II toxin-antitoxin system RelE/ParE family toxin [Candidatus Woesearchaeota archaeon]